MKKVGYIFLFFALVSNCFGQNKSDVYSIVDEMPQYPGGVSAMTQYLQNNIRYPKELVDRKIGGQVFVKFIIDTNGATGNVEILKGSGFDKLDKEAVRVVNAMPVWSPGYQNGKKVRVYFDLPVNFSLQEPYYLYNISNINPYYKDSFKALTTGTPEQVIEILKQAIKVAPDDADIFYNRGIAYYYTNKGACCRDFMAVLKFGDPGSAVYTNCKKYYKNYCK